MNCIYTENVRPKVPSFVFIVGNVFCCLKSRCHTKISSTGLSMTVRLVATNSTYQLNQNNPSLFPSYSLVYASMLCGVFVFLPRYKMNVQGKFKVILFKSIQNMTCKTSLIQSLWFRKLLNFSCVTWVTAQHDESTAQNFLHLNISIQSIQLVWQSPVIALLLKYQAVSQHRYKCFEK